MSGNMMPNIVLITSDQQHWRTLGCNNPEIHTPNLDRLAARGTLFERAYCPNPTCTPSRASIITGQYPSQHGAYSLGTKLDESQPTIGAALSAKGYHTALIGKAHFQPLRSTPEHPSVEAHPTLRDANFWQEFTGPFYGFDQIEMARNHTDEPHVGQHYAQWLEAQECDWPRHFQNQWEEFSYGDPPNPAQYLTWNLPESCHYNTWIAERSRAVIDASHERDQPFFLWSSFPDPHPPYLVPSPWDKMYDPDTVTVPQITPGEHEQNPPHFRKTQEPEPDFTSWEEPDGAHLHGCSSHLQDRESLAREIAVYYGMISFMDKYIGKILDRLDELGIADNTLIIFTSDHGHFFGQHGLNAKGPFHYEDLIRVPFIASWPGKIPAGETCGDLVSLIDLAPTFRQAADLPADPTMPGSSLLDRWDEPQTTRAVIVENRHQPTKLNLRTFVTPRYKITTYCDHAYGELFDLQNDPGELHNLWNDPDNASLKTDLLREWLHVEMRREPTRMPRVSGA